MSFFEITILVLLTLEFLMTGAMFAKVCMPSEEQRNESRVEREMEKGSVDEGFENIMRYSVNGKTGFEEV